jgi:hypothetical protein
MRKKQKNKKMPTITQKQFKLQAKKMAGMISDLKKQLFEIEVMQAQFEARHLKLKPIKSGRDYVESLLRKA